jgi:post-segregation antitoxin (ccd killing protein)
MLSRQALEVAKKSGLNLSRVSENALIEAAGRLRGTETRNGPGNVVRGVGIEHTK